ncbi:MAG: PP2C family protein-serine/threonine phosphatase [Acidobacteriota bacterium]
MSVRTKLVLIFLALSVLPLTALTFISYTNSSRSLRGLVARENRAAVADLQARVAKLNLDLNQRLNAVTRLPELHSLDPSGTLDQTQVTRIASAMQKTVEDQWSLFSEMDFLPAAAPPARGQRRDPGAAPPANNAGSSDSLEFPRPSVKPGGRRGDAEPARGEEGDTWSMKLFLPDLSRIGENGNDSAVPRVREYKLDFVQGSPTSETVSILTNGMLENLVHLPGFILQRDPAGRGIKLHNLDPDLKRELHHLEERIRAVATAQGVREAGAGNGLPRQQGLRASGEAGTLPAGSPWVNREESRILRQLGTGVEGQEQVITMPVRSKEGVVGRVVARIRPEKLLAQVFSGMTLSENEIAFAVDPFSRLHARSGKEMAILRGLNLATGAEPASAGASAFHTARATARDPEELEKMVTHPGWVAVIEKNQETGYTIGVARRVSHELASIRKAALLNLFLGFIFIGLAGSGIIVFSGRMTHRLELLARGARRLAAGDLKHRLEAIGKDEIGQVAGAFNEMADDLEESRRRMVKQERVRRELEIARSIQIDCLPRRGLQVDAFEIVGRSIPSHEVGGDFFNFLEVGRDRLALLIGDIAGKGVPAALLMAEVQATLRTLLKYHDDAREVVARLNLELARDKPDNVYLTLFLGILDRRRGTLTFVNAGQTPPFLLRGDTDERIEMAPNTRPVGLYQDTDVCAETVRIRQGDLICLYTDGVVESTARSDDEEFYGTCRLEKVVREQFGRPLDGVMNEVASHLTGFHGSGALEDDATLVLVRIKGAVGQIASAGVDSRGKRPDLPAVS